MKFNLPTQSFLQTKKTVLFTTKTGIPATMGATESILDESNDYINCTDENGYNISLSNTGCKSVVSSHLSPSLNSAIFFHVIESFLLFLLLIGNVTICWIIFSDEYLRNKANVFVAVLAMSDLCFGCITVPFTVAGFFTTWYRNSILCNFSGFVNTVFPVAANITLCYISVDRLIFVKRPIRYAKLCKPSITGIGILSIFVQSVFLAASPLFKLGTYFYHPALYYCIIDVASTPGFAFAFFVFGYFIPSTILCFCYYRVYRAARIQILRVRADAVSYQASASRHVLRGAKRGFHRTARTLILMILLHIVCWTPSITIYLKRMVSPTYSPSNTTVYLSWFLILVNMSLEPWVYGMHNNRFRQMVRRFLAVCRCLPHPRVMRAFKNRNKKYQVSPFI
ncbi:melatonin receptor type 1B-A-like [Anneissia japonica]|uniref:melatonin receptor type 1B-A-like n=1 Tax=Anneissia japonica TaxID=1529436 RepID=UPI001425878B|nr:melatonin receptor type 1B-A-like [Anneissia japonica]